MTERFYELAGIRFRMLVPKNCPWDTVRTMTGYTAEAGPWDVECVLSVVDTLSEPEGEKVYHSSSMQIFRTQELEYRYLGSVAPSLEGAYMRIRRKGNQSHIQLKASSIPKGITDDVVLSCMEPVHRITEAGGFLLHASWIEYRGKAILFTGPSGVGKSTQAALWERFRGADLINGDRAAVFPVPGGAQVRGIPYCGSSGVNKNRTMPLAAMVCLTQAPENRIAQLKGMRAFRSIWEGCSIDLWNQADISQGTQAVVDTVSAVPVFRLDCVPNEQAVMILQKEGLL